MANHPRGRGRTVRAVPSNRPPAGGGMEPGVPSYTEPEVRRWPHPIEETPRTPEPSLHYIRCALSYQNQLLADIKVLLEQLAANAEDAHPAS